MTSQLISSTVPVFEVDGQVRAELARDLVRLEIKEATDGLKTLIARFVAQGPSHGEEFEQLLYLDGQVIDFGKRVIVDLGPPDGARQVFDGFISGIEACFEEAQVPEVVVFAEDRLMDLRTTRRMRTYEDVSDAEIAEAIASEHGLAADVDAPGPTHAEVQQWNMSDLAFLRERARLLQAEVWHSDGTLHFKTREARTGSEIALVQGNQLIALEARADLAHQRTAVHVSGYDSDAREVIDESADESAIQAEVQSGRTGPSILQSAFGARVSFRQREVPLDSQAAAAWARAEILRRARRFVQVNGTTNGTPDMVVGSRVSLARAGAPFNGGGYYVTKVCHTHDLSNGHRTYFEAERSTIEVSQ